MFPAEETVVSTSMETILAAGETVTTLVGDVFDMMTANPILTVMLMASLVGVGVSVYKRIKKAAR